MFSKKNDDVIKNDADVTKILSTSPTEENKRKLISWATTTKNPNIRVEDSLTKNPVLILATLWNLEGVVDALCQNNNIDLNAKDEFVGNTALTLAIKIGRYNIAKKLIEAGALCNVAASLFSKTKDPNGMTPLHLLALIAGNAKNEEEEKEVRELIRLIILKTKGEALQYKVKIDDKEYTPNDFLKLDMSRNNFMVMIFDLFEEENCSEQKIIEKRMSEIDRIFETGKLTDEEYKVLDAEYDQLKIELESYTIEIPLNKASDYNIENIESMSDKGHEYKKIEIKKKTYICIGKKYAKDGVYGVIDDQFHDHPNAKVKDNPAPDKRSSKLEQAFSKDPLLRKFIEKKSISEKDLLSSSFFNQKIGVRTLAEVIADKDLNLEFLNHYVYEQIKDYTELETWLDDFNKSIIKELLQYIVERQQEKNKEWKIFAFFRREFRFSADEKLKAATAKLHELISPNSSHPDITPVNESNLRINLALQDGRLGRIVQKIKGNSAQKPLVK